MSGMQRFAIMKTVEEIDDLATGAKMRTLREKAKLSLRDLADKLDLSAAYISDLELGRRAWSETRASDFIEALKKGAGK